VTREKPTLVALSDNADARAEREMRAAWAEIDQLEDKLRLARVRARPLELAVWRARGNWGSPTRDGLRRLLGIRS
jgi:hypothetical protein